MASQRRCIAVTMFAGLALLMLLVASAAPAAGQYFEWYAPTDTSGVQWASQTSWQASTALAADRLTVRAALATAHGGGIAEWGALSALPGVAYAWARDGNNAFLFRSEDGGYTWTMVWTQPGYVDDPIANRIDALLFGPAGELWIGTGWGLFLNDDPVALPPMAQKAIALAADPRDPHTLWIATDYLGTANGGRASGIGLFRRREEGDSVRWEDVGVGLPGPVMTIGFDPARPDMVYLRQRRHNVLAARVPETMTPEVVGWSRVPAAPVGQTLPQQPLAEALRVRLSYPGHLVVTPGEWFSQGGLTGYPLALAGLVYAQGTYSVHGMNTYSLHQSRDGGVSWRQVASYGGFRVTAGGDVLWDNRERVALSAGGLPGVAGGSLQGPARHPLDASTLYYCQVGRGHLYRSYDLTTWEELSAGLDPMLTASTVVVDSLSRVYLDTDQGIFMRQDAVRPCRIRSLEVRPDTARIGVDTQVTLVARIEAADPACDGSQVTAVFQEEEHEVPRQPDGSYVLILPLGDAPAPGFYGVTVFAAPPTSPQARVSELRPVMVAPAEVVPILADSVDGAWQMELLSGTLEPMAAPPPGGTVARRVDGHVVFRRVGGEPVHPFGYRLELLAAAADSVSLRALQINAADLETLGARCEPLRESPGWTRILVPAEQLLVEPRAERQGGAGEYWFNYYPAFVDEIAIATAGEVVLGGIRLVPAGREAGGPTAVAEAAAASTPFTCRLEPVFPNPFNAAVTIPYTLPASGKVDLVVYNAAGQRIRSLGAPWQAAGDHAVVWDGRDEGGRAVSSGVYFCRLHANGTVVRKLLLVR